jgi:hypothetical protein
MNSEFKQPSQIEIGTTKSGNSHSRLVNEAYAGSGAMQSANDAYNRYQVADSPGDAGLLTLGGFGISGVSDHSQGSVKLAQLETKERIENPDSSSAVSSLDRLPDAARQAAANGESSVLIATGSGEMVGAFLPKFESEQLDEQVKQVKALGFKAQVRWLENGDGTGFVYELSASWDKEHHPELAQVTAAALQEKADSLAAKKATLSPCDDLFAVDAAAALDESRLPDALKLLNKCSDDDQDFSSNELKFRSFAESVSANEKKGTGLDMTLKYDVYRSRTIFFQGFELK